jgi:cytoskeleton protein RodZ
MSSVGAYLRRLRETRGVSLEEIARVTRVSSSYLQALEAEDFASLPVPVFTRGFVRAYCQALGESPDEALALYDGRSEAPALATPPTTTVSARTRSTPTHTTTESPSRNRGPVLVSFILLVVFGVALFAITLALQSSREAPEERRGTRAPTSSAPPTPAPPGASVPPAPPVRASDPPAPVGMPTPHAPGGTAPTSSVPTAPQITASNAPQKPPSYRLVARTVEETWMRVRTGDGRTTEETIPAGQSREWTSASPFTLTVGNAGGVRLELNGRAMPPLGASGVVIPRLVIPTEAP